MDKLVYTAATGLRARMAAQAAIANNMANASTTGFRADRVAFDQVWLKGEGTQMEARMPASEEVRDADRTPGATQQTGRPLDVAMGSVDSWLAVQAADGSEAYTRRGALEVAPADPGRSRCRRTNRCRSRPTARSRSCPPMAASRRSSTS